VLPTLALILSAYGIYACYAAWPRRRSYSFRPRPWWRRPGRLTALGLAGVGLGLVAWLSAGSVEQEQRFRLAGFLGMSWADTWAGEKPSSRVESLPYRDQTQGDQPAYALLHPEVQARQVAPEKKALAPRSLKKPKWKQPAPAKAVKVAKASPAPPKKEKLASKNKVKKKKPASSPGSQQAAAG
jgi:hypothetical protein